MIKINKYNKLIKNKNITAYTAYGLLLLSSVNNTKFKGGFKVIRRFLLESKKDEIKNLDRECFYIELIKKVLFYQSQDGKGMKFISNKKVKIEYYIENILNYLKIMKLC